MTPASPAQGIAVLVNGYWNRDDPKVLADAYGQAMLKQISAAT
jgi:hypothetical protein